MIRGLVKHARAFRPTRPVADHLIAKVRFQRNQKALRQWTNEDERLAQFYGQFVEPGDIVFDVGANIGNRAKVFSHLGASVVAFEPQPYCISVLKAGFAENKNVTIVPNALGASSGTAEMFISDSNTISSLSSQWIDAVKKSGRFADKDWDGRVPITIMTLDQARAEYGQPRFVKVDVEGFETEVIKGLSEPVRALSFEFTPECRDSAIECVDLLAKLGGYRFNFSLGESLQIRWPDWIGAKGMQQMLAEASVSEWGDVYARIH